MHLFSIAFCKRSLHTSSHFKCTALWVGPWIRFKCCRFVPLFWSVFRERAWNKQSDTSLLAVLIYWQRNCTPNPGGGKNNGRIWPFYTSFRHREKRISSLHSKRSRSLALNWGKLLKACIVPLVRKNTSSPGREQGSLPRKGTRNFHHPIFKPLLTTVLKLNYSFPDIRPELLCCCGHASVTFSSPEQDCSLGCVGVCAVCSFLELFPSTPCC